MKNKDRTNFSFYLLRERGRMTAISHTIFPFHVTDQLFCLPAALSLDRSVFRATTFESSGNYYVLYDKFSALKL